MRRTTINAEEVKQLWEDYHRTRNKAYRDELTARYMPMVHAEVRRALRTCPPTVDPDDILTRAQHRLWRCVELYDPDNAAGKSFGAYARASIRSGILDARRDIDRLSRARRARLTIWEKARDQLTIQLGRKPSDQEVADETGLDYDPAWRSEWMVPIDEAKDQTEKALQRVASDDDAEGAFAGLANGLPFRGQVALYLRYIQQCPERTILAALSLTAKDLRELLREARDALAAQAGVQVLENDSQVECRDSDTPH